MTGEARIRVAVADDQAIIRDGLVTVLGLLPDIEVVGEAADGEEAVALAVAAHPDVLLMDLRMPVLDGAGATARVREVAPETAVLILTTYADDESIVGALRAGARGYLTKDAGRAELAAAVRAVASGQTTLAPEVGARVIGALTGAAPAPVTEVDAAGALLARFPSLTRREAEVLALIGDGLSNAEIARSLFVSVATVKTHINAIFAKLAVRDRAQAIALVRS
ncbi:DNA-binding response regulator, NarL/FixJ family, contains REC and HTH domains [Leifsonia sp. 98AMF]|uniref:response regulator n=1 Tax=unclassified Leifsonia TaxID=2663824 RepID=UPI00087B8BCF|nr:MULTISPECIES: response regulator transcription factor [unclassified Leifsonia]SDH58117.1 DNA-binding response regulator, NarL/FixJ family, contains REC and HTH domains [Leifsonia sp. 197AMF]SDI81057.1 DNA-binding response regulator, NarL/FixJ family, contains REC and HTH domains [Leifsonia sp. 466MF]SDK03997.1 DNA-binding response regulator, NarL/FixJ family, contains REC and HTH domains [Leifsonia sp. 157MF]SDN84267.1 DNA-binding response regulator, NarL/FixJ family, contains REC and HTH do